MTNVEKLEELGIIGDIRQRLGGEDEHDTSKDNKINSMDRDQLIELWCGWVMGDGSWWITMKAYYDRLGRD